MTRVVVLVLAMMALGCLPRAPMAVMCEAASYLGEGVTTARTLVASGQKVPGEAEGIRTMEVALDEARERLDAVTEPSYRSAHVWVGLDDAEGVLRDALGELTDGGLVMAAEQIDLAHSTLEGLPPILPRPCLGLS
ncbi:hypothetical protein BH20CHL7_BH20CHL7_14970 [soil metagenome]